MSSPKSATPSADSSAVASPSNKAPSPSQSSQDKMEKDMAESSGIIDAIRRSIIRTKPQAQPQPDPIVPLKNEQVVRVHYDENKLEDNIKVNDEKENMKYTLYYTKAKQENPYTKVVRFNSLTLNSKNRVRSFNNDNNQCYLVKLPTNMFHDNDGRPTEVLTLKSSDPKNETGGFNRLYVKFPDMFINLPNSTSKPFKGSGDNDVNVRREIYIEPFRVGPFKFNKTVVTVKYGMAKVSTFSTNAANVLLTVIYPSFVIEYKKGKQIRMPAFKVGPITFPRETNKDGLTASSLESDPVGICIPDLCLPSDQKLELYDKESTARYKFDAVDYGPVLLLGKPGDNIIRGRVVKLAPSYTLLHPLNTKTPHHSDFTLDVPTELCKFTFEAAPSTPIPYNNIVATKNEHLAPHTVRETYSLSLDDTEGKTKDSSTPVIDGVNYGVIHDTCISINFMRSIETANGVELPDPKSQSNTPVSNPSK